VCDCRCNACQKCELKKRSVSTLESGAFAVASILWLLAKSLVVVVFNLLKIAILRPSKGSVNTRKVFRRPKKVLGAFLIAMSQPFWRLGYRLRYGAE